MVNEPAEAKRAKGRASLSWQTAITVLHDIGAAAASWLLAYELRFNFEVSDFYAGLMFADLVWILPIQALVCWRAGMYRGLWRYASLTDLRRILVAAGLGALAVAMLVLLLQRAYVPRSVVVLYPILLAGLMSGSRIAYRAWKEGRLARLAADGSKRVIVLGAGVAGANLLKSLGRSPEWTFIGLLDDDPARQGRDIDGVKVLGALETLSEVAARLGVEQAIIAMPGATHSARRRALELCSRARIRAMTVPSYEDLMSGRVTYSQIRPVELDDLLGRDPVTLDSAGLREWLRGRTALVTGAGGSIGTELSRPARRLPDRRRERFHTPCVGDADAPANRRVPCRRLQTRASHGRGERLGSGAQQRPRNVASRAGGDRARCRETGARLHRQSGQPHQRHGRLEAPCRTPVPDSRGGKHAYRHGSFRQRAWVDRQRDSKIPRTDRQRWPGDGHARGHHAVFHVDP